MSSQLPHLLKVKLPPLMERTASAVMKTALAEIPDKLALRGPERELTYRQLVEEGLNLAGAFVDLGVERQKVVLAMLDNSVDFVLLSVGLSLTARIEAPINTGYRGSLLAHVIRTSGSKIMIVEAKYVERLVEIAGELDMIETLVVRGEMATRPDLPAHMKVIAFDDLKRRPEPMEDVKPWDTICIIYTSGTTGPSKGAMISHAQAYSYASIVQQDNLDSSDVSMVVLPLFHVTAKWAGVYAPFIYKATAVILPGFSASTFFDSARKYGATSSRMLGTIAQYLLNQPERPDDKDQPIKKIGITPVIADLERFKERFGVTGVATGYGSTEASVIATAPMGKGLSGYAGYIRDDYEARIVDENDMEVAPGEVGEMVVRSREPWMIMQGYVNMPEATAKVMRNGWFHTGDLMRMAPNGQLIFCDRNNDAIRRKGENISSFEIEREINAHPAVFESAAIKAPSDHADDDVKACIAIKEGHSVTPEEIIEFLTPRLSAFMLPRYIEFFDALPKTPTEKILKADLRKTPFTATTYDRETKRYLVDGKPF